MKKIALIIICILAVQFSFGQNQSTFNVEIPMAPFQMRLASDSSLFTNTDLKKKQPMLFMLFSPTCGHCRHQTQLLQDNIKDFKDFQIVMISWLPYDAIHKFYLDFHIYDYPNITLGTDTGNREILNTFNVSRYPKLIIYDKKGNYVADFNGDFTIEEVQKAIEKI